MEPNISVDIERLIGRLVLEHEMTKATALAERRKFMAEIERLNGPVDKSNATEVPLEPATEKPSAGGRTG